MRQTLLGGVGSVECRVMTCVRVSLPYIAPREGFGVCAHSAAFLGLGELAVSRRPEKRQSGGNRTHSKRFARPEVSVYSVKA